MKLPPSARRGLGWRAVLAGLVLASGAGSQARVPVPAPGRVPDGTPPWREVVWYEVFVRSFQDSDGDGVGDLRGLEARLPYLADLGVGGIWLMPIHPSPSYHGYDVTDYLGVHPDYGTEADLRSLVTAAHALGIRVILDFVPNHTSDRHPWFAAALAGDARYRGYYRFEDDPPPMRGTRGGNAWHDAGDGTSYLGLFSAGMPDLDLTNPAVTAELERAARHWLELGVDGFRVDAIQHLVEGDGGRIANTPATYAWVAGFEAFLHEAAPGAFLVGETWTEMPAIVRYHVDAQLDMSFDYPLWKVVLAALQARSARDLAAALEQTLAHYPEGAVRGTFLSNHDQTRHATRLSFPRRDEARLALAAGLLLTLPGTPFLYYGEEIGMTDGPGGGDLAKRTPMRWEAADAAGRFGFSSAAAWTDAGEGTPGVSVAEQAGDPTSLLTRYRRLLALRRELPALRRGEWRVVDSGAPSVLALERRAGDEGLLVVANLATKRVALSAGRLPPHSGVDLVTGEPVTVDRDGALEVPALALLVLQAR